jgi:hypothetical protein
MTYYLLRFLLTNFFLILVQSGPGILDCAISEDEYNGLWSLWTATNGSGWEWAPHMKNTTHWSFPSALDEPCSVSWQGLTCNTTSGLLNQKNCSVVGMTLDFNLYGSLSPQIGNLQNLQSLIITNNPYLITTLPDSLYELTLLTELDISNNTVFGKLNLHPGC